MAKYAAFGTTLKIGGTAGTAVINVESIEGPEQSVEMLDMTAHDSGSAYREKVAEAHRRGRGDAAHSVGTRTTQRTRMRRAVCATCWRTGRAARSRLRTDHAGGE